MCAISRLISPNSLSFIFTNSPGFTCTHLHPALLAQAWVALSSSGSFQMPFVMLSWSHPHFFWVAFFLCASHLGPNINIYYVLCLKNNLNFYQWIHDKKNCVCVCVWFEYYSAIKKKGILLFVATWMNPEGIMLSEISQTEKDTYCTSSLRCEFKEIQSTVVVARGWGGRNGDVLVRVQMSGYKISSSGDLKSTVMTTISNAILYAGRILGE